MTGDTSDTNGGNAWRSGRWWPGWRAGVVLILLLGAALGLRLVRLDDARFWVDEAESSINALTILQHGYPTDSYLGQPIYENTLIIPWDDHPEYEFRDASYSDRGVAVYHAWLPLYAIAGSMKLFGIEPDEAPEPLHVQHAPESWRLRTVVPRLPAVAFSLVFLLALFALGRQIAGGPMAWSAVILGGFAYYCVSFGTQARYYSATIAFSALCGLAIWQCMHRGRWRDFTIAGVVLALLFHTHILSCFILVVLFGAMVPYMLRHRRAFWKMALAGGILNLAAWPWMLATGFIGHAVELPKAYQIMDIPADLWEFPGQRLEVVALVVGGLGWLAIATALRHRLSARLIEPFAPYARGYIFLSAWLVIGFVSFSLLIPAASYFLERLTLVLEAPGVLLTALVISSGARLLTMRHASLLAGAAAVLFLMASGRFTTPSMHRGPSGDRLMRKMIYLDEQQFEPGTRMYATPNRHLVLTYYTGMPIQSLAPVRKSFLDSYEHPIVIIEYWQVPPSPGPREMRRIAREAGEHLTWDQVRDGGFEVAVQVVSDEIGQTTGRVRHWPEPLELTEGLKAALPRVQSSYHAFGDDQAKIFGERLLFRGFTIRSHSEWWQTFFYRFVDPASRMGENLNFASRIRDAEAVIITHAACVVYHADRPVRSAPDSLAEHPEAGVENE